MPLYCLKKKKKKGQPKTFFFWCVHDCKGSGRNQSLEIKNSFVDKCDDGQFDLSYASEGNVKLITCRLERNRNRSCPSRKKWALIQLCSVKELKGSDSTWEPESMMVEMEGCRFWCKFCSQTPSSIKMIKKKNQSENEQNGCVQRQLLPIYSVWTAHGLLTHKGTSMLQKGWIWLLNNRTCKKKKKKGIFFKEKKIFNRDIHKQESLSPPHISSWGRFSQFLDLSPSFQSLSSILVPGTFGLTSEIFV